MSSVVRFLHASDFRLGEPIRGLEAIPAGWADRLAKAPYQAVERVVETALAEEVAFVLLAGDLIDPQHCGATALSFLCDQFQLLADQRIPVFWSLGRRDHARRWGDLLTWPGEVHVLPHDEPARHELRLPGGRIDVVGQSWPGREQWDPGHLATRHGSRPTVFVGYGEWSSEPDTTGADYWALGGRVDVHTERRDGALVRYAGSPQPRRAGDDAGSCFLVDIDDVGHCESQAVATESIRWLREPVIVEETDDDVSVVEWMLERARELQASSDVPCLVAWDCSGPGAADLPDARVLRDLVRGGDGIQQDRIWTAEVALPPIGRTPEAGQGDDTILGDFLRVMQDAAAEGPSRLKWELAVTDAGWPEELQASLTPASDRLWRQLVGEAADSGRRRLGGGSVRDAG